MVPRFRHLASTFILLIPILYMGSLSRAAQETKMARPAHGLAMHGKTKYDPGFKHFGYVNPSAPKGGTVRLWAQGGYDSFNRFIIKGEAADGIGRIYDTLMRSSADEPFSQYGLLAESIETPEDRSWVKFTLRQEGRWHDGKSITADDVIWTFNTLIKMGNPGYRYYYASIAKAEKLDAHTVKFTFKPGENRELPLILGQLAVLPKHYWLNRDFTKTTLEPPLGSGPYRIKEFEANRHVTYERVREYWGKDLPVNIGLNNFDMIRYDYYRNAQVAVEAFKAGAFDFRTENSSKIWATSYNIPEAKKGYLQKLKSPHQRTAGMQGFVLNTRRGLLKNAKIRQALAYAFDFEWSNRNLFYRQYTRSRSYFDNSELAARGLPSKQELEVLEPYRGKIPEEVFTQEYVPPATKGDGRIRSNLRIGDKLLKEAGWVIKDLVRINAKTSRKMTFEILLVSPLFERVALPFIKNLRRLGIKATVRTVDTSQYIRRRETFDFDMIVGGWGQSLSPGNEQRNYWGSKAATQKGSQNFTGIKDPVVDKLIEKLIAAPDRRALVARTRALDRVLLWGHYVIPHWHIAYDRLVFWNKFGRPEITPMQGSQFDAWWVDAAKAVVVKKAKPGLKSK